MIMRAPHGRLWYFGTLSLSRGWQAQIKMLVGVGAGTGAGAGAGGAGTDLVVAAAGRGEARQQSPRRCAGAAGGAKLKRSAASSSPSPLQLAVGRRRSSIAHYPSHPHARSPPPRPPPPAASSRPISPRKAPQTRRLSRSHGLAGGAVQPPRRRGRGPDGAAAARAVQRRPRPVAQVCSAPSCPSTALLAAEADTLADASP